MPEIIKEIFYLLTGQYEKTRQARALNAAHDRMKLRIVEMRLLADGWTIFPEGADEDECELILENYLSGDATDWFKK